MARIIGITDIHGEYYKLCNLLDNLELTKDDKIVFMGDYIDRGKMSRQTIDKVIETGEVCECIYLIGSHEYAMMRAKDDKHYSYLFWNYGGDSTVESYGSFDNIMLVHGDFFKSLKPYYLIEDYLFVHAGIKRGVPLEEQDLHDMVYLRSEFYNNPHDLKQKIIFGHTEFDEPQIWDDKICIDTGCGKYKDALLTAFISENGREYFINSA